jgi:hypothetical protein
MTRSWLAGKRALVFFGLTLAVLAAPRVAFAQDAQADPLKFATSKPVIIGWVIRADKTAEFEAAWAGIRALLAKSDKEDLKAFGATMSEVYKVDQPPFDYAAAPGGSAKAVIYLFRIDAPSTAYSYTPREILYVYLKAGQEGSPVTRAAADDLYTAKLGAAYLTINPLWSLTKIGG